ncbi:MULTISPECIES: HAD family hydrolase [unclassified Saccharicrinis]|uniref:HAD family hydrolase n=1 Tax=unclassified Saccharicrinis TaxID=2646859 RepID=UPI003D333968
MDKKFKYIGFDADDTLWVNETYFRETEHVFAILLRDFCDEEGVIKELYKTELKNLKNYGYGIKGFILSLIETADTLSDGKVPVETIMRIVELGKELLNKPVVLIDGIEQVLISLTEKGYKLIVATKGDLLDQERKLRRSNLEKHFHHIEVMSDKKEANYKKLLAHLDIAPEEFLMVGNSLKSDVIPVLNLGGSAVHVPFHTTWEHEHAEHDTEIHQFVELETVGELMDALKL